MKDRNHGSFSISVQDDARYELLLDRKTGIISRTIKLWVGSNLPDPAVLARKIVESLETALEQFRGIEDELEEGK